VLLHFDCEQLNSFDTSDCDDAGADEYVCEHAAEPVPPLRHAVAMSWHLESA
jgi:hypothetical protein